MFVTRLWVGAILILLALGILLGDQYLPPWYPFLFVVILGLTLAATHELLDMTAHFVRPNPALCYLGCGAMVLANWLPHWPGLPATISPPWPWIAGTYAAFVLSVFLVEMAQFTEPGLSVRRVSQATWMLAYIGLLASFLAQLRWLHADPGHGAIALALAIFVTKSCDIGAYCTGRLIGKHPMAPVLSPKKTWEGAAGGLVVASLAAVGIDQFLTPSLLGRVLWVEIAFGISVGLAGMLGDLAESLIKRDSGHKDAAQTIPGFGGILDVVDALLFAGPVVYAWLSFLRMGHD